MGCSHDNHQWDTVSECWRRVQTPHDTQQMQIVERMSHENVRQHQVMREVDK